MTLADYFGPMFSNLKKINIKVDGILYNVPLNGFVPNLFVGHPVNVLEIETNPWRLAKFNIIINGLDPYLEQGDLLDDEFNKLKRKCIDVYYTSLMSLSYIIFYESLSGFIESEGETLLLNFDS